MSTTDKIITIMKESGGSSTAEPIAAKLNASGRSVRGHLLILTRAGVMTMSKDKPAVWSIPENPGMFITRKQSVVLDFISKCPGRNIAEISRNIGQHKDHVLGAVARLEQVGYVTAETKSNVKHLTAVGIAPVIPETELEPEVKAMPLHQQLGLSEEKLAQYRGCGLDRAEIECLMGRSIDEIPQFINT